MILQNYLNLITSQHQQKPKFMGTLEAILKPVQNCLDLLDEMRLTFDIDTAIGAQLDDVGVRVGRTRFLHTPLLDVYFSLDINGVGLDEGVWLGLYDKQMGLTRLPDDMYRILLKAKVAANRWDGTIPGAYEAWEIAFQDTGSIIVIQDNQDMSMVVGIAGSVMNPVFEQLLLQGYIPLKPMGVRVKYFAISTENGPLFALDSDNNALAGFDKGSWAKEIKPIS